MCGIGGWFGPAAGLRTADFIAALRHRGPDGEGEWLDPQGRAGLAHTRLAILDLSSAGQQPMTREGRYHLVLNGEIYNFRELRSQLETTGERFVGQSDTEVLLRLLIKSGPGALSRLAGMFALAFYDSVTGHGFLARDDFGIKPLYYTNLGSSVVFASEVKALTGQLTEHQPSPAAVRDTLMWGSVPEPCTLFEAIKQVPAGCYVAWSGCDVSIHQWHKAKAKPLPYLNDPVAATRQALRESIERHFVSDVPVGIFLSGGVDSTAVLALARDVVGPEADLRTFSIGFEDPVFDESATARRTAAHFRTRHSEWCMTIEQGRAQIAGYLQAMDQPSIDGFNTWCVSRLAAREGMKVVLSGLGGDELFGGYDSFQHVPRLMRGYRSLGPLRALAAAVLHRTTPGSRWRRAEAFLRGPGAPLAAYHVKRGIFTEPEARELAKHLTGTDPGPAAWHINDLPQHAGAMVSWLEWSRYMRNQLLRDSDVFSMAHGIELRVPFVDSRLFSTLQAIPATKRFRRGKQLLVDAVPEIPSWVRGQPKRGFRFPFQQWISASFDETLSAGDRAVPVAMDAWYRRWAWNTVVRQSGLRQV